MSLALSLYIPINTVVVQVSIRMAMSLQHSTASLAHCSKFFQISSKTSALFVRFLVGTGQEVI